jgi:hypothetical protein
MFHGIVDQRFRPGDNNLFEGPVRPLRLKKNTYGIADVLKPHRNLVVSERVKQRLGDLPNVQFAPVEFTVLFSLPYRVSDWSPFEGDYHEVMERLNSIPDDPRLHESVPEFYEVIAPRHEKVAPRFSSSDSIIQSPLDGRPLSVAVSRSMLEEFPVLWTREGIMLSAIAFDRLRDAIDPVFFICSSSEY